jgi:hypothetical protein
VSLVDTHFDFNIAIDARLRFSLPTPVRRTQKKDAKEVAVNVQTFSHMSGIKRSHNVEVYNNTMMTI